MFWTHYRLKVKINCCKQIHLFLVRGLSVYIIHSVLCKLWQQPV